MTAATTGRAVALGSLALWLASLALPAITVCDVLTGRPDPVGPGYELLMIGWLGFVAGQVGWYANPALLVLLGRMAWTGRPVRRWVWSALPLLIAATTLLPTPFNISEGPVRLVRWCRPTPGYVAWLLAAAGPLLATVLERARRR